MLMAGGDVEFQGSSVEHVERPRKTRVDQDRVLSETCYREKVPALLFSSEAWTGPVS